KLNKIGQNITPRDTGGRSNEVFKTAALNHSATLPCVYDQILRLSTERTKRQFCYPTATLTLERRIDRRGRLAVVLSEQVSIDAQGNVGLGMPQAFADGHDIDALIDEL